MACLIDDLDGRVNRRFWHASTVKTVNAHVAAGGVGSSKILSMSLCNDNELNFSRTCSISCDDRCEGREAAGLRSHMGGGKVKDVAVGGIGR